MARVRNPPRPILAMLAQSKGRSDLGEIISWRDENLNGQRLLVVLVGSVSPGAVVGLRIQEDGYFFLKMAGAPKMTLRHRMYATRGEAEPRGWHSDPVGCKRAESIGARGILQ